MTRDILKILWKRGEIAPQEQFLLFSKIFLHVVRFSYLGRNQIFTLREADIRDKRVRDSESQLYFSYFFQKTGIDLSCKISREFP